MVVVMKKGDLLADLVSHYGISQTLVRLHGWGVHGRLMGMLMESPAQMDDEVHFYLRPNPLAEDGLAIELEYVGSDDVWTR